MNSKIITIAGILFALAFVAVFLIGWSSASKALGNSASEINSMYSSDFPIDVTLFENRWVTGDTLTAFTEHINEMGASIGFILPNGIVDEAGNPKSIESSAAGTYNSYLITLGTNQNGVVDRIIVLDTK